MTSDPAFSRNSTPFSSPLFHAESSTYYTVPSWTYIYSPLIAEMLVSALKSFLICNRKALHCNRDSWYTFVYTLYHEEWLGDQAVSVYILCRSGSYLPYLTCDCANFHVCLSACMQLQYHWKWVHTVVLLSAGRNQASLITACANFLMCGLQADTYQEQLLHIVAVLHVVTWMN